MAYSPIGDDTIKPGINATAQAWSDLLANGDALYEDYAPPVVQATVESQTSSTSFVVLHRWKLVANQDNHDLQVIVQRKVTGSTGHLEVVVDDGTNTDTASVSFTATSFGEELITVSMSNTAVSGSHETREVRLRAKIDNSDETLSLRSVTSRLSPAAPQTGREKSGYIRTDLSQLSTSGEPIPSERVQRLLRNMVLLPRERPACLVSLLDDEGAAEGDRRRRYGVSDGDGEVLVTQIDIREAEANQHRMWVHLSRTNTAVPALRVVVTPSGFTDVSGTGWHEVTGYFKGRATVLLSVDSGSGNAFLDCLQLFRDSDG